MDLSQSQMEDGKIHPLLLPNVVAVLLEHLNSRDIYRCRRVCPTWHHVIGKRASPLLNPKIIANVLQFLPKATLIRCRLICSLWNENIRNAHWPEEDHVLSFNGSVDFQNFIAHFPDPDHLPFPFAFTSVCAWNNISLGDPITQDFFRDYGSFFKSLTLHRCKWDIEDFRNLLFEQAVNLEHLRVVCGIIPGTQAGKGKKIFIPELSELLHVDPSDFPVMDKMRRIELEMNILDAKDNPRPYVEQFLTELFASFPNVEEVNMDVSSWYARTWATNFLASNENVKLPNLKVLNHLIDPDLSRVINLQMKQFPLTTLRIRIRYKDVTLEALHELLVSLKHTLTDLQLVFLEYRCAHEFPSSQDLYKLRRFELWKFRGQLNFLQDFAGLEELLIGEMSLKGQCLFNQTDVFQVLLPKLKSITFKDYWETKVFS